MLEIIEMILRFRRHSKSVKKKERRQKENNLKKPERFVLKRIPFLLYSIVIGSMEVGDCVKVGKELRVTKILLYTLGGTYKRVNVAQL